MASGVAMRLPAKAQGTRRPQRVAPQPPTLRNRLPAMLELAKGERKEPWACLRNCSGNWVLAGNNSCRWDFGPTNTSPHLLLAAAQYLSTPLSTGSRNPASAPLTICAGRPSDGAIEPAFVALVASEHDGIRPGWPSRRRAIIYQQHQLNEFTEVVRRRCDLAVGSPRGSSGAALVT